MPVVARFYGIAIRMYFREHGIPHFHAVYGDHNAVFAIESLARLEGELPRGRTGWYRSGRRNIRRTCVKCGARRYSGRCRDSNR